MDFIISLLKFVWILFLAITVFNLLIVVHEWGHFLAARWRGLQVDRFQIWFGKPIWKKEVNGVQYGLGSIPFGGFVALPQMAPMESIEGQNRGKGDGEEGEEAEPKKPLPPISAMDKIIVAFAGPLFSFLLAVAFAVLVWAVGKPVSQYANSQEVGYVAEGSPADKAGIVPGDKILTVDGKVVERIHGMSESVQWYVIDRAQDEMQFEIERDGKKMTIPVVVQKMREQIKDAEAKLEESEKAPWWKKALAFVFKRPQIASSGIAGRETPMVKETVANGPAEVAGLMKGDSIVSADGIGVTFRTQVSDIVKKHGSKPIELIVKGRDGQTRSVTLTPRIPEVLPEDPELRALYEKPLIGITWDDWGLGDEAHPTPIEQISGSLTMMKNTLGAIASTRSEVNVTHLSSAVGIIDIYYRLFGAPNGWKMVMWFSVVLNINLAILNLLPFPVLDGGHIVMATLEGIRRKPLNLKLLEMVQSVAVFCLFGLMLVLVLKDFGAMFDQNSQSKIEVGFKPIESSAPAAPAK